MTIPTEAGLYWARKKDDSEYTTILRVLGDTPFLKVAATDISTQDNFNHIGIGETVLRGNVTNLVVGPKIETPPF